MATRKSTWACEGRLPVSTNTSTVICPRVASDVTGLSSSESKAKSTGAHDPFEIPGTPADDEVLPTPQAPRSASASALVVALLPDELVFTVREEDIERGERSVTASHVL